LKKNNFLLLSIFLIKKQQNTTQIQMEVERNGDTRTPRGYPNPVGYEFEVLVFIPIYNWDGFEDTQTLWVWIWGEQNPFSFMSI
jgi:hypothetical protein